MARRPTRPRSQPNPNPPAPPSNGEQTTRERIIAAFMALLAEKPIDAITLTEIGARAGITLVQLRDEFNSPLAILAAQMKATDRQVLAGIDADMAQEPPRDRLFDVLMRPLEALPAPTEALR